MNIKKEKPYNTKSQLITHQLAFLYAIPYFICFDCIVPIELVKRNELSYAIVADAFGLKRYTPDVEEAVDISITYEGYIKKQMDQVDKVRKLEEKILPKEWDYTQIKGISLEAQQKLNKIRPHSIGQASRISGVSPADVSVLLIQLEQYNRSK